MSLKTPEDYIQDNYIKIKNALNIDDININRMGFMGFMFELLGQTQYDVKGYVDNLFAEAFPITASNNENLLYHSGVYGYKPKFATPSSIQGTYKLDFDKLPIFPTTAIRREIIISDSESQLNLKATETFIDSTITLNYISEADYKIIFERLSTSSSSYRASCEIKKNNEYEMISLVSNSPYIPIYNLKQYTVENHLITLPKYTYGLYHSVEFDLVDFIYDITVEVKEQNTNEYKEYLLKNTKSFANPTDEFVFFTVSPKNKLILDFGSGVNGKYIPYASVKISLKLTKGGVGNISTNLVQPSIKLRIMDFDINNSPITSSSQTIPYNNNFISANITGAYDGKNAELDNVLRTNLIKYIQSRNNLMSEVDFKNNLKSYFDVCEILFKKTDIIENIIYVYVPVYDRYLNPINTLTTGVLVSDFEKVKFQNPITKEILIYEPEIIINNKSFVCPFLFIYNTLTRLYEGYFVVENSIVNYSEKETVSSNIAFTINLYIEVEFLVNKTRIWLRSYSDITSYEFRISSSALFFDNSVMSLFGDSFYIDYFNGIIRNDSSVVISLIKSNTVYFKYKFNNVKSIYNFSEILKLKAIPVDGDYYIANLPLIDKNTYFQEKSYYQEKILSFLHNLNISQNRMLSDEVQLRFLNSYYIDEKFVKDLILQYTITPNIPVVSYYLPFKLEVNMDFAKTPIISQSKDINDEADSIIMNITNFLLNSQTGLSISFYRTKIIDIIHNNQYIKNADVILKDANDYIIPNSNFENVESEMFIEKLKKADYLNYSPIYYWFDLNNIKLTLKAYD